jgi:murein DD-endopeptidase MepM/ murein hydrolase activator NlpD
MQLQQFFAYPLHPSDWKRPSGSKDYRITNRFGGADLVNGGTHGAVDAGNFRQGDPVKAPTNCRALGLTHADGAIGLRFDLGGGWLLELWHLDSRKLGGTYVAVKVGEVLGTTGDTGALVNGKPMSAHTHIELKLNGVKKDPEPYLPIVGRQQKPIPGATAGYTFIDVPPTHKFYADIEWMVANGITSASGVNGSGYYQPDGNVTRGQLAAFLRRESRVE